VSQVVEEFWPSCFLLHVHVPFLYNDDFLGCSLILCLALFQLTQLTSFNSYLPTYFSPDRSWKKPPTPGIQISQKFLYTVYISFKISKYSHISIQVKMTEEDPTVGFYIHLQSEALSTFLSLLRPHLPFSNGLYNRIQAPHNLPSRHCLFAATFPPSSPGSTPDVPEAYTILFADRSRHSESQIWIFNPLITQPAPLSAAQHAVLSAHTTAAILFLKDLKIPDAPGWPFSPVLRFACLHEYITSAVKSIAVPKDALAHATDWNLWNICTSGISSARKQPRPLPRGFTVGRVPDNQLEIVLSTSTIPRQASTMRQLPNVGLLNQDGKLVAWAYVGIDGSFITLYVLPGYRGKCLATYVGVEMLGMLDRGEFADLGFNGSSGWVHSDVKQGNGGSEGVMRSLGGNIGWVSSYVWVDSEKL
jgi:hypothetical protein